MKLGCHVSMSAPDYVLGAVKEAVSYGANAFMLYTGAPQNTRRKAMSELKIEEAHTLMKEHGIEESSMIVHAPYIINLANCVREETFTLGVEFLQKEIARVQALRATVLVLHPGSHVKAGEEEGLKKIVEGLDQAMTDVQDVQIAIETMAGKGSEIGGRFEELAAIIERVELKEKLGVCMDTCHVSDAGYDIIGDLDGVLEEFDRIVGLDKLRAMHINDSQNPKGAKKDRHAKIGEGCLGLDTIVNVITHPKLKDLPFILETPNELEGYAAEIALLRKEADKREGR